MDEGAHAAMRRATAVNSDKLQLAIRRVQVAKNR